MIKGYDKYLRDLEDEFYGEEVEETTENELLEEELKDYYQSKYGDKYWKEFLEDLDEFMLEANSMEDAKESVDSWYQEWAENGF